MIDMGTDAQSVLIVRRFYSCFIQDGDVCKCHLHQHASVPSPPLIR